MMKSKGFTLIELMIVIAIIMILAGAVLGEISQHNEIHNSVEILSDRVEQLTTENYMTIN